LCQQTNQDERACRDSNGSETKLHGKHILLACGTRPAHDPNIPCDGKFIFDADQILHLTELPRNLIVAGAGVIGIEYASMLGSLADVQVGSALLFSSWLDPLIPLSSLPLLLLLLFL